jgi:hypothetical protein
MKRSPLPSGFPRELSAHACREPGRHFETDFEDSISTSGFLLTSRRRSREELTVSDELDLVRSFRSDIPGPSTDAWARARAAVTEASGNALSGADERPRTRRRWPLTVGLLGTASGTAALVSVLMLGGPSPAFAGWSATPRYLTAAQTAATQNDCRANLPTSLAQGSWTQVATDTRGPYTVAVYKSGTTLASCLTGPSFTTVQAESLTSDNAMVSASGGPAPGTAGSSTGRLSSGGEIEQLLVSHFSEAENGPYTVAEGRLEPGVSAVTLVLGNGQDVTATSGSGWLVAWWPGSDDVTAAQITSTSGTVTVPLSEMPSPTPPRLPGNGSPGSKTAVRVPSGSVGMQSTNGGGG